MPGTTRPDPAELAERFERAHEERYGYRDPEGEVVLVDIRLAMVVPGPRPRPAAAPAGRLAESPGEVRFDGGLDRDPGAARRARRGPERRGAGRLRAARGDLRRAAGLGAPGSRPRGHDRGAIRHMAD